MGNGDSARGLRECDRPMMMRKGPAILCISKVSVARISESIAVSIDMKSITGGHPLVRLHHPPLHHDHPDSAAVEHIAFDYDFTTLIDNNGMFDTVRGSVNRFLAGSTVGIISEGSPGVSKSRTLFHGLGALLLSVVRYLTGHSRRPHHQLQLRIIDVDGWDVHDLIANKSRHLVSQSNLQQLLARFELEPIHAVDTAFLDWWRGIYARRSARRTKDDPTSQLVLVLAMHFPATNVLVLLDQPVSSPRVENTKTSSAQGSLANTGLEISHTYFKQLNNYTKGEMHTHPMWGLLSTLLPDNANTDIVIIFHLSSIDYPSSRYLLLYKKELEKYSMVRKRSFSVSAFARAWRAMTSVGPEGDDLAIVGPACSRKGYVSD